MEKKIELIVHQAIIRALVDSTNGRSPMGEHDFKVIDEQVTNATKLIKALYAREPIIDGQGYEWTHLGEDYYHRMGLVLRDWEIGVLFSTES